MKNNLAAIRAQFGFTQEQLAEKLGKDVSTISRWERGKTSQPMLSPLVRVANRRYQYVKHMMDQGIADAIADSSEISGLFFGPDLMILTMSKGTLQRYPLLRTAYGFSATSYFRGEGKRVFEETLSEFERALATPGSSAFCKAPPNSAIVMTEGLIIDFNFVGYNMVHIKARIMSDEEALDCKVATMRYTFG